MQDLIARLAIESRCSSTAANSGGGSFRPDRESLRARNDIRVDELEPPVDAGGTGTLKRSFVMELIVRAVDVGFGNTKFITGVASGDIRCASIPSLAYPSARDPAALPAAERRKTIAIPINGLYYEVGQDVALATDNLRATHLHDRYTETPEYMALLRGALALMKFPSIDLLVVGLPVSHFMGKKAALEKAVTGTHDVGGGKTVVVRKALVVAQPQGALVYYAATHQKMATIEHEQSLIIDPGSRTFDWLVARGMRLVLKTSDSVIRGVSHVLRVIAHDIGTEIGTPYTDLDAIDRALRTGKSPMIYQKTYDISKLMPMANTVAERAVGAMLESLPADYSFQNIILVGGGAFLFKGAVKQAFPKHRILEFREPMYANVRGFQIAGMNYARSVMELASGSGHVARMEGEGA
jgi:plasmid segregation protein ParM